MASEYDALLESTPTQKSEYDALLAQSAQPSQPKSSVLGEIGTAIKNTAVGFVKGLARPPSLAEIALPIFGGQIERQYEHAKAAEQAIRSGQPAATSIAQAYAPNVSELASPEATRGQKIQAGVNIAAEVAPFLVPALRGIGKYGVAGRSLSDIAFGAKPEPLQAETAAAEQIQKGGEISAKKPYSETGAVSTEQGKPAIIETAVQAQKGDTRQTLAQTPAAPQVAPAVPQPEQPRIISTAVQTPEGIKTGASFNQPHDEIVKGAPEESKGFMVRDANGQERFVGRTEAADVAKAAGQVKPENAGTTELHSQQLAPVSQHTETTAAPISKEDVGNALNRTFGRDEKIRLETINDLWDEPYMQSYKDNANKLFNEVSQKMKGVPFDQSELKRRVLQSEALMEGKPEDAWPMPVYVAEAGDKNTVGLLLNKDGKLEMFEGNDEATPKTLDLVNKLLGNEGKTVTVYTSQPADVIQRIKQGDIPEGIFVSPSREHAASYWGEGREVTKLKIPLSQVAQHSEIDWQVRPKSPPQTPAVTEPTTAQPLPKTEPPLPPETPEELGQALKEPARLAGPSNRVLQERAARGEIPQAPESGVGILKEDLVAKSRAEYSPERAAVAASKIATGESSLMDEGVAVVHEEALTKAAADAERALKANPTDPALKQAHEIAVGAMSQWQKEVIQPMKTNWSNKGINLQGATDVDTGSLVGLQKLAWDTGKGDFTPEQLPIMDEAANRVTKGLAEEKASILKSNEVAQKILKPKSIFNLNELRESLQESLKTMTC